MPSNGADNTWKDNSEALKNSTMFHMSLGSKELFHSNFLHWISIVDWDNFLKIMRSLAGVKSFWWESDYHPNKNNIKILRENQHFDLSIYILDSEQENVTGVDDGEQTTVLNVSGDKRKVQKWMPVLVLENKMKSLPYEAQLNDYAQKAFDEWCSGRNTRVKNAARDKVNKSLIVSPNEEYSISFVLLSLLKMNLQVDITTYEKKSKNPIYSLQLKSNWSQKTYRDFLSIINETFSSNTSKHKGSLKELIIDDYISFVNALCNLASYWIIDLDKSYRDQIYPWNINTQAAKNKSREIEKYKELRIHDIHEKILYNQLLDLLEKELVQKGSKRYNSDTYKKDVDSTKIFTKSDYYHGIGVVEAHYVIDDKTKLIIQVQGDRYCHMVICKDIIRDKDKDKLAYKKNVGGNDKLDKLQSFISSFQLGNNLSWGRYGNDNNYKYVTIPQDVTIKQVIDTIVKDIDNIKKQF